MTTYTLPESEVVDNQRPTSRASIGPTWRVALYSHDTMGIGHVRRNLLLARAIGLTFQNATMLVITGAREASVFDTPPGTDILSLPSVHKELSGSYRSRRLGIPLSELLALRSDTIAGALAAFDPHVLIVDKVPRGLAGELDASLRVLSAGHRTRCVLGLRDVLDDVESVRREWQEMQYSRAIQEYFDAIWIYGDPRVYDPVAAYGFPHEVSAKVRYTGYLDARCWEAPCGPAASDRPAPRRSFRRPYVLCAVGGGQDGARLAEMFVQAKLPPGRDGVILAGPFMPPPALEKLRCQSLARPRMKVLEFVAHPTEIVQGAERVVAMGGYNTFCEVLAFEKRALIVPRVEPRVEQLLRAECFQALGLVDLLHPRALSPEALSRWLAGRARTIPSVESRVDLGGLRRVPQFLAELLSADPCSLCAGKKGASHVV